MSRNLTLTIDEELLREARKVALDRNSSVNQLVREFLEQLVRETSARRAALEKIEEIFQLKPVVVGTKSWTRDDLHER